MSANVDSKVVVVIPNLSAAKELVGCLDSLLAQSLKPHIIVVDNASTDNSVELIETKYPKVELIKHDINKGYAGGVNPGFRRAIELKAKYAAPFNNDAVADKDWLKKLVDYLDRHDGVGIAACKVLSANGKHIDSTGDYLTNWGLPYPRGRGETDLEKYDKATEIFAASGAASLYRVAMLTEIGLLDEDFFAYYEDVDISFRAQLAGWKVASVPTAVVHHETSTTSNRMRGFATYQTMKNLQLLVYKNVPGKYLGRVNRRLFLAQGLFFCRAITRGHGWAALKGDIVGSWLVIKKRGERRQIQNSRKVSDDYIWDLLVHDLPPNAHALRRLRAIWWKLTGKSHV